MGDDMSDGGDQPAAGPDWGQVKRDYLRKDITFERICTTHGITREEFDARRKAEGWKRKLPRNESTAQAIRRLKELLHRRLADLEAQLQALGSQVSAADSEREIKAMNTLVRTLEKVLELERKHNARRRRGGLRIIDNQRRLALAERIEALAASWPDDEAAQQTQTG
jgi:chromosome segregation ATPase